MRILHLQSVGGASGDMILATLIALGVDPEELEETLQRIASPSIRLRVETIRSHGLQGVRVRVEAAESPPVPRRLAEIRKLTRTAALPPNVEQQVTTVFNRLAAAEAEVHGVGLEEIHFHEVGGLDSIADVIGACLALSWLQVDRVMVAPLPLGQGAVTCSHGVYPTPAPATAQILKGFPVVQTAEPFELVTPTGAAVLTAWASPEGAPAGSRITRIGHGFGHRELVSRPNLLRGMLFEWTDEPQDQTCLVLQCQVDDTVPELIGTATSALLSAGALDVYAAPVQMKKQRPGILLTVLCSPEIKDRMLDLLFRETTTLGVREQVVQRTVLPRRFVTAETSFGPVRVKVGSWKGMDVTNAPELDDCVARAAEQGVTVRQVYEAAQRAAGWGGSVGVRDGKGGMS